MITISSYNCSNTWLRTCMSVRWKVSANTISISQLGYSAATRRSGFVTGCKWKYFRRFGPFVREIHWSLVNSPHNGQWCRALMVSLIYASINGWVNNIDAVDLKCHHTHYDVTLMCPCSIWVRGLTTYPLFVDLFFFLKNLLWICWFVSLV